MFLEVWWEGVFQGVTHTCVAPADSCKYWMRTHIKEQLEHIYTEADLIRTQTLTQIHIL